MEMDITISITADEFKQACLFSEFDTQKEAVSKINMSLFQSLICKIVDTTMDKAIKFEDLSSGFITCYYQAKPNEEVNNE